MKWWQAVLNSSEATKRRYAFVVAVLFTGLIGLVWMISLSVRLDEVENREPVAVPEGAFSGFLKDARSRVDGLFEQTSQLMPGEVPEISTSSDTTTTTKSNATSTAVSTSTPRTPARLKAVSSSSEGTSEE